MELTSKPLFFDTLLHQPWHWAVGGLAIALMLFATTWMGKSLGISASFDQLCTMLGAGKRIALFDRALKQDAWRMVFVLGVTLGGAFSALFLSNAAPLQLSAETTAQLTQWGIQSPAQQLPGRDMIPADLFNWSNPLGIFMAVCGGFLVGFGARYARGCTSGHAITGLSHLQLQSLLTVIGFFVGGLIMTWGILPLLFGL